jgi:hypothetical protein
MSSFLPSCSGILLLLSGIIIIYLFFNEQASNFKHIKCSHTHIGTQENEAYWVSVGTAYLLIEYPTQLNTQYTQSFWWLST